MIQKESFFIDHNNSMILHNFKLLVIKGIKDLVSYNFILSKPFNIRIYICAKTEDAFTNIFRINIHF